MRVQQADEWALELPDSAHEAPERPTEAAQEPSTPGSAQCRNPAQPRPPSSKSNLKPLLRERGELERPAGKRKAGRPPVIAPWFQAVATRMADGTPLREALALCGIYGLTSNQIRSLYRNRAFQALYTEARRKFLSDYGRRSPQSLRKMRQYAAL
jgi:hypothetical protein